MKAILVAIVAASSLAACAAPVSSSSEEQQSQEATGKESASLQAVLRNPIVLPIELSATCQEPGRYDVQGGAVIDTANGGRIWQRAVDPTQRTQPEAIAYCESLVIDGQGAWRLPVVQELQSLRLKPIGLKGGPDTCMPSIDQTAFPATPAAEFWSATTRPAGDGLYTGFDDGRTHPADLATPFYVRCVRDAAPIE